MAMVSGTVGIDIGGANLKLADTLGNCRSEAFPLWLHPNRLGSKLAELLASFSPVRRLAVTMTGELADCYATRRNGVESILAEVENAFPTDLTWVYSTSGDWATPFQARVQPWSVAASNWHVLANWLASQCEATRPYRCQLMIDIGSTTVDIIPLKNYQIATTAKTDRDRMQSGQLVYTGVERTSIASIVQEVRIGSQRCPVMAERFATSSDAYLVLGLTDENPNDLDTADGRPRTIEHALSRLARTVGEDLDTLSNQAIRSIAEQILDVQADRVSVAIQRTVREYFSGTDDRPQLVCAGHGRPLMQHIAPILAWKLPMLWLDEVLSPQIARCAPAYAAALMLDHAQPISS